LTKDNNNALKQKGLQGGVGEGWGMYGIKYHGDGKGMVAYGKRSNKGTLYVWW
jgi:hypothetical protein